MKRCWLMLLTFGIYVFSSVLGWVWNQEGASETESMWYSFSWTTLGESGLAVTVARRNVPQIDRLAIHGVRFENCYTTVVCGPSRVQLLTGRYPHRTGWYLHHDAALYGGGGLDSTHETTMARLFGLGDMRTGIFGKWQVNNLYEEPDALRQHGFDEHVVWPGSIDRDRVTDEERDAFQQAISRRDADYLAKANAKIESRYWDPVLIRNGERKCFPGGFGPDILAREVINFVDRHHHGPFFLYWPMLLTHGQNFLSIPSTLPIIAVIRRLMKKKNSLPCCGMLTSNWPICRTHRSIGDTRPDGRIGGE